MGIEYYFEGAKDAGFTTGVFNSGWRSNPVWTATGLDPITTYYFRVKARDTWHNETAWSSVENATTDTDVLPFLEITGLEAHTADDNLTNAESGSVHSNLGASGTITLYLPDPATPGVFFWFAVQATFEMRIDPGTAAIRDNINQTDGKYRWADGIGECLGLIADENGDWVQIAKYGVWSSE